MKKIIAIVFMLMLLCTTVCFANNIPTFTADVSQPDADGICNVTVSIEACDFNVFQLALRYDTKNVVPYGADGQEEAAKFDDFAIENKIDGLNIIGKTLDIQNGVFGFTGFVLPGQEKTHYVNQDGIISAQQQIKLYTFSFKTLDGKAPVIEVAVNDGKGFQKSFEQGLAVGCKDVVYKYVNFVYKSKDVTTSNKVEYVPDVQMTKQERLENTVYLQANNYAFAQDGVLDKIDDNDKSITAQIIDGKMLVPIRCIAQAFNCEISWDDANKIVSLVSGHGFSAALQIGNINAMANDKSIILGSAPYIKNGRTFVQIDDVERLILNAKVWLGQNNDAVITTGQQWQADRQAEREALDAMVLVVSPFVKIFG